MYRPACSTFRPSSIFFCMFCSHAIRQRKVLLLPIPHQRAAVDLAPDSVLHHVPPVELSAGVHCLHSHCCQVKETNAVVKCDARHGEKWNHQKLKSGWMMKFVGSLVLSITHANNNFKDFFLFFLRGSNLEIMHLPGRLISTFKLLCNFYFFLSVSYGEVRSEQLRETGPKAPPPPPPEMTADKVSWRNMSVMSDASPIADHRFLRFLPPSWLLAVAQLCLRVAAQRLQCQRGARALWRQKDALGIVAQLLKILTRAAVRGFL